MPLPPRIDKGLAKPAPRVREGMDREHLAKVRQCPCAISGSTVGVEAHHLLRTGERGMSMKSPDKWAIPLKYDLHQALHDRGDEEAFLAEYGIDGRALARGLWAIRGKPVEHYRAVCFAFRQRAALKMRAADG